MNSYRNLFISEAREHLRGMSDITICMETASPSKEELDALFRHSHSLKGMAATMGYDAISMLAHRMEDLMDRARKQRISFTGSCADLILEGVDLLDAMVRDIEGGGAPERDIAGLVRRIHEYVGEVSESNSAVTPPPAASVERGGDDAGPPGEHFSSDQTVRIRSDLLDQFVDITGELVTIRQRLTTIAASNGIPGLSSAVHDFSRMLRELQHRIMQSRMMPFGGITGMFPRLVRDLGKRSGKKITLEMTGVDIELDRAVLERMGEPLTHIIRNAVDHGIESPEARVAAGKPESGTIRVQAFREKDCIAISIDDDGRGMEPRQIIASALRKGFISPEDAAQMSSPEALMLTCIPGFSTAETVTEVSGRGAGMDAVNALVRSFGGTVSVESEPGQGSRITLRIPRTIAIVNVLLVGCGPLLVGVPLTRIRRLLEVAGDRFPAPGETMTCMHEGEEIPLLDLGRLLGIELNTRSGKTSPALVTEMRGRTVGLLAERITGQQEVFIRSLGRPLDSVKGLAGTAMLGDGSPLLILDVHNLA